MARREIWQEFYVVYLAKWFFEPKVQYIYLAFRFIPDEVDWLIDSSIVLGREIYLLLKCSNAQWKYVTDINESEGEWMNHIYLANKIRKLPFHKLDFLGALCGLTFSL